MPDDRIKLTIKALDKAPAATPEEPAGYILWDTEIPGFGCRVSPKGKKTFILYYRTSDGRRRRPRIGELGTVTVAQARGIAKKWLAEVALGGDPSNERKQKRKAATIAELAQRFLDEHSRPNKAETSVRNDELWISKYIVPALGKTKIADLSYEDADKLHKSIGKKKRYAANRTVACLSTMMSFAERKRLRPQGTNPCQLVERYKEAQNHRDLSADDLARLHSELLAVERSARAELENRRIRGLEPWAARQRLRTCGVIRMLLLTGARFKEIASLKWSEVDLERGWMELPETKTGPSARPLNSHAIDVLTEQRSLTPTGEWVFPGRQERGPIKDIKKLWAGHPTKDRNGKTTHHPGIRDRAGLGAFRLHHFRHNFIAWGESVGLDEWMVAGLVGHATKRTITRRYAGLQEHPARKASQLIANELVKAMNGTTSIETHK